MDLSIIIVSYNTEEVTVNCLASIFESVTKFKYEVIVVDNNSSDNTVNIVASKFPQVKLIASDKNNGFSIGNNIGICVSIGRYVLLLNSDTILFNDSIETLLTSSIKNGFNISGPILLNSDFSIQRSWFNFPSSIKIFLRLTDMYTIFYKLSKTALFKLVFVLKKPAFMISGINESTKMNYLSFACILLKREVIDKLGMLDEELRFYHEDCEYGIRAHKNNYEIIYNTDSKIVHLGGTSSSNASVFAFENDIKGLMYVYRKHYSYNKFLTLKIALYSALSWRILCWHFGFFRQLKKIGLYESDKVLENGKFKDALLSKYKELRIWVRQLKYYNN